MEADSDEIGKANANVPYLPVAAMTVSKFDSIRGAAAGGGNGPQGAKT